MQSDSMRETLVLFFALALSPLVQASRVWPVSLNSAVVAVAQDSNVISEMVKYVTVRVEGATQGSGVIIKREGGKYLVLTAWHVLASFRPGEELDVYTYDGKMHRVDTSTLKRIGNADMGILSFQSQNTYNVALAGEPRGMKSGDEITVAGFPNSSAGKLRQEPGILIANATLKVESGYQLLYSNKTISGMSGGPIFQQSGRLIGIHGRGEIDAERSNRRGYVVKTGTNLGIPLTYYNLYAAGLPLPPASVTPSTADDYLVLAKSLLPDKAKSLEVIVLSTQSLALRPSIIAYLFRATAHYYQGNMDGAISDYNQALSLNPNIVNALNNRGAIRYDLGDLKSALEDFSRAIALDPDLEDAYYNRAMVRSDFGDQQGALQDLNQVLARYPRSASALAARGPIRVSLGEKQAGLNDIQQSLSIDPRLDSAYSARCFYNLDQGLIDNAISDCSKAAEINPESDSAFHLRALARLSKGDIQGSIVDSSRALVLNPKLGDAYLLRGTAKTRKGDDIGAIQDLDKSIEINSESASAWALRGTVKVRLGNSMAGCSDLRKAAELGWQFSGNKSVQDLCH